MKTENILSIIMILVILLIISGMIAPRFFKDVKPPSSPIHYKIHTINAGIDVYKLHTGEIPRTLEDLITCPTGLDNLWKGPYLKPKQTTDPWGNLFVYEPNLAAQYGYDLISYGADAKPGGKGYDADIYND